MTVDMSASGAKLGQVVAYIDTNVLLEFEHLGQHDWLALLGARRVTLSISAHVMREVDALKDRTGVSRAKRQRAKTVGDAVEALVLAPGASGELRTGVDVRFDDLAIPERIYEAHQLDPHITDHAIVAAVLHSQERHPTQPHAFVSDDGGARRTALRCKLRVVRPDSAHRLVEEDDEAREERRLKRQLAELQVREPEVSASFRGSSFIEASLPKPMLPVARFVEQYTLAVGRLGGIFVPATIGVVDQVMARAYNKADIARYNREASKYRDRMGELLPRLIEEQNSIGLFVELSSLQVSNVGGAPAQAITLTLTFPRDTPLAVVRPEPTAAPRPPRRPVRESALDVLRAGSLSNSFGRIPAIGLGFDRLLDPSGGAPRWMLSGHTATIERAALQHQGEPWVLPPLLAALPSYDVQGMAFEWKLLAHNMLRPRSGQLQIAIKHREKQLALVLEPPEDSASEH